MAGGRVPPVGSPLRLLPSAFPVQRGKFGALSETTSGARSLFTWGGEQRESSAGSASPFRLRVLVLLLFSSSCCSEGRSAKASLAGLKMLWFWFFASLEKRSPADHF